MATPVKNPLASRPSENSHPNLVPSTPSKKATKSPSIKPASAKKPAPKTPKRAEPPPPPPPRERKFILAKKNSRRGEKDVGVEKRQRAAAHQALRTPQDGFFRRDPGTQSPGGEATGSKDGVVGNDETEDAEVTGDGLEESGRDLVDLEGSSKVRKMRSIVMAEALSDIPEPGSGRVMHLVKAFESLVSISKEQDVVGVEEKKNRVINWALPGLQHWIKEAEAEVSSYSGRSGELFPSREFERDSGIYSSMDSHGDRLSLGSRTSSGGRRSRRNSTDSCGSNFSKKLKVTNQQPFKLRTEQRGRLKEEHFLKKVKEMLIEEEKKRIHVAQGLPWTTDEPEVLVKPPIKESTEPIDLVLHSDVRAVERAEFDHYVTERISFAEQMRLERERQQKLEEEEEIRTLRKELVPRAQPMPYFDRPFVPKKSSRPRTMAKEPRFRIRTKLLQ